MRGIVDRGDQLFDPGNGRRALLAAPHQHDALHDVVVLVEAGDAEPRLLADRDGGDVLDQHRIAAATATPWCCARSSIERIRPTPRTTADCAPMLTVLPPTLMLALLDGLQHLRQRQPVGDQLVEIDLQFIGLGLAAPAGDVDHAGHGAEAALQHPVLQRLEVEHAVVRRSFQAVAKDFADRAERRNSRLRVARQRRQLRQPVQAPAAAPPHRCSRTRTAV